MNTNPLGFEHIGKLLRKFAIPSIIAMLVGSLYNIVDQIFIGQGVGYLGNAATNVAFPLSTICLAIALLIGIGSATRYSLSLGRGDKETAARIVGNDIVMLAGAGLLYMLVVESFLHPMLLAFGATEEIMPYALSYTRITGLGMPLLVVQIGMSHLARADGSPRYSMLCMVAGAVINTILDPIFIFGFGWGVAGAAAATVLSQLVSFCIALNYLRRLQQVKLHPGDFVLRPGECAYTLSLGLSNSLNQLALTFVQIVMNNSLTYYGARSIYGEEIPLAACGIVLKVNAILLAVIIGISQGTQPIIGFNYGAGQYGRVRETYRLAITANLVVSAVGFAIFQLFPQYILAIFGQGNELYFRFAIRFMHIFLLMMLVNGVQLISSNFFAAIGKPLKGMFLSMTRQVLFLIPLLLILPLFWGIDGLMFAAPVADALSFLLTMGFIRHEWGLLKAAERQNA